MKLLATIFCLLFVLVANASQYTLPATGGGGGGTPGGSNQDVQFNDGGMFGGVSGFTFDKSTNVFKVNTTATDFLTYNNNGFIYQIGDIYPAADASYSLGTGALRYLNVYSTTFSGSTFSGNDLTMTNGYFIDHIDLQGVGSYLRFSNASHHVDWKITNTGVGSDQIWSWADNAPGGSGGVFLMDGSNVQYFASLTGVSGDYLGGDGQFHSLSVTAPNLTTVLAAGDDAGTHDIRNVSSLHATAFKNQNGYAVFNFDTGITPFMSMLGDIYPDVTSSHNLGSTSLMFSSVAANAGFINSILPPSGELQLGNLSSDLIKFVAGDDGSSPANQITPAKWIRVKDSSGSVGYLPFYQ